MTRVLVTGVGGPAGRSLTRQLRERGIDVVGTDMADVDVPGVRTLRVPAARDGAFLDALAELVVGEEVDLLVPTVTEELVVLAAAIEDRGTTGTFGRRVPVVVGTHRAVAAADDKLLTAELLAEAGVPVPVTFGGRGLADLGSSAVRALGTPWLSKPRSGRGGRGVVVHDGPATAPLLRTALRDGHIVQSFAPGTEYAPNLYVARDEGRDVVVTLRKTSLAHGLHGNATGVQRDSSRRAREVGRVALSAARALGLRGPVDVDVRLEADGTPVVLEINARFGANSAHAPEVLDALLAEYLPTVAAGSREHRLGCASAGAL